MFTLGVIALLFYTGWMVAPGDLRHLWVVGSLNSAYCASRGLIPEELLSFDLWWNGPPWLSADPIQQPPQPMSSPPLSTSKLKVNVCAAAPISDEWIEKNFSSYSKLLRVNAWIHPFISNARTGKNKKPKNLSTSLSVSEIKSSETHLFSLSQNCHFHKEICCLSQGHPLKSHSCVISLNPFIGKDGLLWVGGLLSNSSLSLSQKHPPILDGKDVLTHLLVCSLHVSLCHCGPSLLLSSACTTAHILGARRLVRDICR